MFGFTNDKKVYDRIVGFYKAAVDDGWNHAPLYRKLEPESSAAKLNKDGYVMQIIMRDNTEKKSAHTYEAQVAIWGPDNLAVRPPQTYSMDDITKGIRTCNNCGKTDVDTVRYSFAGRCCNECFPAMRERHEQPGWCD